MASGKGCRAVVLAVVVGVVAAGTEGPARGDVTREQVERAIRGGVGYLRRSQHPDGSFPGQPGMTELVTLALLTAGQSVDEPTVARALQAVRPHAPGPSFGTYAVSLQTMALAAADPVRYRREIARNAIWLEQAMVRGAPNAGGRGVGASGAWTYNIGAGGDNSNTQYAVLGLSAARDAGVPVGEGVWAAARRHWELCQQRDGGWGYQFGQQTSSASMTVAGISSLLLTGRRLYRSAESLRGAAIHRCGTQEVDIPLARGINWLANNFQVDRNQGGSNEWTLYYLYGLERAGRLSGQRFFGRHDWYREGAEQLVRTQDLVSGHWSAGAGPIASTSFALLFLAKGRAPVLIVKLRHGRGDDWNNDRDDVNNLTSLIGRDWNHLLTWQVSDPSVARVEDLLQAPIAFLTGHDGPSLSPEARRTLREYVDQGGVILADACCGRDDFDRGFRALVKAMFPEPQYELHPLPPDHSIWHARHVLSPDIHELWGIEYGCRTVVIYSPSDLSCFWNQMENAPGNPAVVKAVRVGQNIVDYATGREMPADKLAVREVVRDQLEPARRGALQIAKLRHAGDWNVAPMAVPHLTTALRDRAGLDVVIAHRDLAPLDPNLVNYPFLYIHGRTRLTLSADEQKALRRHLDPGGGTIFADAACGSPIFDAAFRKLVAEMLPDHQLVPVPRDDPLFTRQVGYDLSDVKYTKAAGGRTDFPDLEGVQINGHWAVIYSKLDVGCALERPQGVDCPGYTHESAVRIAANVVLYSTLP